ncbi:hypothetical protein [Flavobacterium undicola]|uniref:hypothetical protein n=1 Tax=Flavobacterium undicola TaxID=1932779 RepID=UPI0015E23FE1|nr:hypothetical protein [Flavobacterium undicola]MBA0884771.1 hypothetical protein [Flavobacterium undicola]
MNSNFINSNPTYYQKYPSLFSNSFLITKEQLDLLDISGYLYYQATIFTDRLIDEKDITKFPLITICQEESIKILTSIYGLESNFWILWNKRRNEYLEAIVFEKVLSKKEVVTIEEYETLADTKSAFGKVAIDCLYSIDNTNVAVYEKLLLSHKYFSVAFQLNDDIQDFKEDLKKGQFNWAVYLLKQQNIINKDPDILVKYLYIRGVSKQMYLLGIDYCNKALDSIENIAVPKWKKVLVDTKKSFTTAIIEIENYIEVLTSEVSVSNDFFIENNLQYSILSGIQFIKSKQQNNGSWREYVNQGGISNTWATAFITSKISESENLKIFFENEILKALDFLNQNTTETLWSYNTTWIEDADSTNFVLLSFLHNNIQIENEILENWLFYQTQNGSFSTYSDKKYLLTALDDKNISNVNGWLSIHNCVSAVSFYFLAQQNQNGNSFLRIKNYFDKNLKNELNSYWWTSSIYTYYYLAKTYQFLDETDKVDYIVSKINAIQNENGSFSDVYGENVFYTGLALEILLLSPIKNKQQIEKTISYLLQNQFSDGSWQNSNALQVPNAQDTVPNKIPFPIAPFGMNVRAKEFNRLFTTTSVLQSLSVYEDSYSSVTF